MNKVQIDGLGEDWCYPKLDCMVCRNTSLAKGKLVKRVRKREKVGSFRCRSFLASLCTCLSDVSFAAGDDEIEWLGFGFCHGEEAGAAPFLRFVFQTLT